MQLDDCNLLPRNQYNQINDRLNIVLTSVIVSSICTDTGQFYT